MDWARTTVNPFSVQEIADAIKGTDTPVLIKNPINPDLSYGWVLLKKLTLQVSLRWALYTEASQ